MPKRSGDSASERAALAICPEAPYPVVGGGPLRTASLLEYLAQRYALDVVLFREAGALDPAQAVPPGLVRNCGLIELPLHSRTTAARAVRNAVRYFNGRPPLNDRFYGFNAELSEWLSGRRYDVALIEHFWCAPYVEQTAAHAERTILDLHNVESEFYRTTASVATWPASAMFHRFAAAACKLEREWIPRVSGVLVTSEADAARVRPLAGDAPVHVYPNAIPLVPQPRVPEDDVIVFSGNLEYGPNISAVRFFRCEVWPKLRERFPSLRWRLVGRGDAHVARVVSGDPRIECTGPVRDAIAALAAARVVVVPVLAGSGTRVKILEAWAAGRAVVSTTIGAEGLPASDGEHLVLANRAETFVETVTALLGDSSARARLGAAGRALYESQMTWECAWKRLSCYGF